MTADQVKDWSQIKAVMIHFLKQLPPKTSVGQFTLTGTALDFKNEAQKTGYLNSVMMATDLNPFVSTKAGIRLTGQATLKARLHYVDAQGHDQYIAVPNLTKTYTINQDTLAAADFSAAPIPANLIPANYELSPAQPTLVATGSEAGADAAAFGQIVRYYFNGDTVQFELVHQQQVVTKTYVRTINYEYDPSAPIYQAGGENQVAKSVEQSYKVTMTTDLVTGQTTYQIVPGDGGGTQTTSSFTIAGTPAPGKAGYTANPTEAANAAAAWQIDIAQSFAQHANQDPITETQTVHYTADPQKAGPILVDDDAQGAQLKALTANGKFGQAIDFSQKEQSLADLIAALARQHYLVNPTATDNFDYQTGANYQADDAKNQFVIHFVHEKIPTQRTATITRTVHYQYANGQLADEDQVAQQVVTQTGEKDLVTNQEHYDQQWSANVEFAAGRLPSYVGYTAKIDDQVVTEVPADQVTITGADFKDQAVETTVVYHANEQHAQLVIIDDDASEASQRTLQTLTATGKYATAIDFTAGTTYQVDDKQNQFVVHLGHELIPVMPDQPKTPADALPDNPGQTFPQGVGSTDLNKTGKRVILVHQPDGQITRIDQAVHFTRTATVDEATGQVVSYTDWQADGSTTLAAYVAPTFSGYTADQAVAAQVVTPTSTGSQVDIYYTANAHTTPIEYVDDDNGGAVVKTGELTGQTGETVATHVTNPDPNKYEVVPGTPEEITFGPDGHAKVTVHLKHKTQATSRTKTVTQTITYHLPDGTTKVTTRTLTGRPTWLRGKRRGTPTGHKPKP